MVSTVQFNPRTFLAHHATNIFQTACWWGARFSLPLCSSPDRGDFESIVNTALEVQPPGIAGCAVGMPMDRLIDGHSGYLYNLHNKTSEQSGISRGTKVTEYSKLSDLDASERRFTVALGNSMLAAHNRFSQVPWVKNLELKFTGEFIKSSWSAHYNGNSDREWENLNWDNIADIALGVVKDFEESGFYLSDGYWFHQALGVFHERMKKQNGWAGLPDRDLYQEENLPIGGHCWINSSLTLHAAYAARELYRNPQQMTFQELGINVGAAA